MLLFSIRGAHFKFLRMFSYCSALYLFPSQISALKLSFLIELYVFYVLLEITRNIYFQSMKITKEMFPTYKTCIIVILELIIKIY